MLPFLYQTQTLRLAARGPSFALSFARLRHTARRTKRPADNAIPFQWEAEDRELAGSDADRVSTITPSEAQIFRGIFHEIAEGKMPASKRRSPMRHLQGRFQAGSDAPASSSDKDSSRSSARSSAEKARISEFRDKFLSRYPRSLQNAAQVALGLHEVRPRDAEAEQDAAQMMELEGDDEAARVERELLELERSKECERVEALMKACKTDAELWSVMEREVFSLPEKLHIAQAKQSGTSPRGPKGRKKAKAEETNQSALSERVMNIHGPLYSRFLTTALDLFDSAFARPSPYIFQILPRIKELGLPSFVLGVSTPFYAKLADIYWRRFGDASSALDMLHEMNSAGLFANAEVNGLISQLRNELHACAWGGQGPFVMAMMESPPYDGALMQRLEEVVEMIGQSSQDRLKDHSF
ncbi:hypothetical protein BBK36DRAFT_1120507 [Trichoderma citrinoviride]|uniref:Mtf2-like C-terminal domain-containing protein n=1 Tax=Trichoderma citrinoviride TaxID=58853 RepID=A0A2T4B8V1_9HYPO|nr:hypothetical protein BBK36DRAFT_1120507 [Trichoderma citrinoviride]PTB65755.1 hypothetical protein BBK36DRAFT_1120507 [Trichoderma citrinoviride]